MVIRSVTDSVSLFWGRTEWPGLAALHSTLQFELEWHGTHFQYWCHHLFQVAGSCNHEWLTIKRKIRTLHHFDYKFGAALCSSMHIKGTFFSMIHSNLSNTNIYQAFLSNCPTLPYFTSWRMPGRKWNSTLNAFTAPRYHILNPEYNWHLKYNTDPGY